MHGIMSARPCPRQWAVHRTNFGPWTHFRGSAPVTVQGHRACKGRFPPPPSWLCWLPPPAAGNPCAWSESPENLCLYFGNQGALKNLTISRALFFYYQMCSGFCTRISPSLHPAAVCNLPATASMFVTPSRRRLQALASGCRRVRPFQRGGLKI